MYKITIAMPVYNVQRYIYQAFLSILNQTIDNIELLIIDDCGSDKSIEIIKDIINNYHGNKTIRIIKHEYNMGLSVARNTAINEACGKYIYFIDSDDFITNNCIESMSMVMDTNNVDFVVGSYQETDENGKILDKMCILDNITMKDAKEIKEYVFKDLRSNAPSSVWNKLYKLSFLKDNNLFFVPGTYYEDNMFSIQSYMLANSFTNMSDITYYYRQREGSIMHIGHGAFSEKEIKDLSNIRKTEKNYLMNFAYCKHFEDAFLSLNTSCFYEAKAFKSHNFNNLYINLYIENLLYCPISIKKIIKFKRNKLKHLFFLLLGKLSYKILKQIL